MVTYLRIPVCILTAYGIHIKAFTHDLAPHDAGRGDLRIAFNHMGGIGYHDNLPLFIISEEMQKLLPLLSSRYS